MKIHYYFLFLLLLNLVGNTFLHADPVVDVVPVPVNVLIKKDEVRKIEPVQSDSKEPDSSQAVMKKITEMLGDKKVQEALQNEQGVRFQPLEDDEDYEDDEDEIEHLPVKNGDFYNVYIKKYYPKVFAIRDLFAYMKPDALEIALHDITMVFSQDPAYYFVDNTNNFKISMYWEFIVDQCSFMDDFLRRAKVDIVSDSIIAPSKDKYDYDSGPSSMSMNHGTFRSPTQQNLFLYLKKTPQAYVFDFYALCFDYLIKLFNEGILMKNMHQAQRYVYELEYVVERLKGSRYEAIYQEALKTSKELMTKLKKIVTKNELEEDDSYYDEKTRKMMQEGKELGFYS